MAVSLQGTIKRFVGLSTDELPTPTAQVPIPAGSVFFAIDTFQTSTFDGDTWSTSRIEESTVEVLREAVSELQKIRVLLETSELFPSG